MTRISIFSDVVAKSVLSMAFFSLLSSFYPPMAAAQPCGTDYVVKRDETLASIATKIYGNPSQWRIIFYANQDRLGTNASLAVPGVALRVPCVGEAQEQQLPGSTIIQAPAAKPSPDKFLVSSLIKRVEFLTAEGYAPLTGRDLPNGGILPDVISASMELIKKESKGEFDYRISWVNDWAAHINPLLTSRAFDVGFPWEKPDCEEFDELDAEMRHRCQKFFFSDPLYEILEVLYVRSNSTLKFVSDDEAIGKKICLTVDNGVDDLDGDGRNWVRDSKITLIRPASLQECFSLLEQGVVDALVTPDMTGRAIALTLGIADKVKVLPRPVAIQTVHVIVSKNHPQANMLLYYVNTALAKLRESGEYDRMVEKHLSHFWATYEGQKSGGDMQSVKGEKPNSGSSKPEQSDSVPRQRGISDPKSSHAGK